MQLTMNLSDEIKATCRDAVNKLQRYKPTKWALHVLKEGAENSDLPLLDTPDKVAAYWRREVATDPHLQLHNEVFVVLVLNTRRHCKGHVVATMGTLDTLLVHPRDVFRPAIVANAAAIVVMHNHPSGDPSPSEQDIRVTRDFVRAGNLLKIEVLDHVIIGEPSSHYKAGFVSLRELGYMSLGG